MATFIKGESIELYNTKDQIGLTEVELDVRWKQPAFLEVAESLLNREYDPSATNVKLGFSTALGTGYVGGKLAYSVNPATEQHELKVAGSLFGGGGDV